MRIDIWSDVVCPWCYVGKRRFERALTAFAHGDRVQIVHRSFQLNPAAPRDRTSSRRESLKAKYRLSESDVQALDARMERTAAAEGLEFHMEAGSQTGNTLDAHRVLHLAADRGRQDATLERFFRGYFTEQRSLFDHASLLELAADAGLDAEDVRRVLSSDIYAEAVADDVAAAKALGVNGVPFFAIDGQPGISGAQPSEVFAQALTHAWDARTPRVAGGA
jgi:predicted DsbA family dithiol-disulfide isomerase